MKWQHIMLGIITTLSLTLFFSSTSSSMDDPGFIINRMVMCGGIADKEPVNVTDTFSTEMGIAYCFLEAKEIENDTTVTFIWYFESKEMARVSLPLTKGKRWRTYTNKKLADLKGNWTVELLESSGIVLNTVSFQVQ